MRLTATYDVHGNIAAMVASPPASPVAYLEVKPGQRTTEIEVSDLQLDLSISRVHECLADLIQNYRVDAETAAIMRKMSTAEQKPASGAE
jgi:hypothetical protein